MHERFHPFFTIFGVRRRVTRLVYVSVGVALLVGKYALESALLSSALGRSLTTAEFLSPFAVRQATFMTSLPPLTSWLLVALHLPFLWVGMSMSARRAIDAGLKPWWGFLFVVPGVQFVVIATLSILRPVVVPPAAFSMGPFRTSSTGPTKVPLSSPHVIVLRVSRGVLLGSAVCVALVAFAMYEPIGLVAVFAVPISAFFASAFASGPIERQPNARTLVVGLKVLAIAAALLAIPKVLVWINGPFGTEWMILLPAYAAISVSALLGALVSVGSLGTLVANEVAELNRRDLAAEDEPARTPAQDDPK